VSDQDAVIDAVANGKGAPLGAAGAPHKPPKKSIKSTVTVHDRTQIETVFDYFLNRASPAPASKFKQALHYQVDAYLFYPRQFGLDADTYPKTRFFTDVRPLLRFREPKLNFKALMGQKPGVKSPLVFLRAYIESLAVGQETEPIQNAIDEVRLAACTQVGGMLRGVDRCRKRFLRLPNGPMRAEARADVFRRMIKLLDRNHRLLLEIRSLLAAAARVRVDLGEPLAAELRLVDEYCYYRFHDSVAYLLLMSAPEREVSPTPEAAEFIDRVRSLLALHNDHGTRSGYLMVGADSNEAVKERYMHRRGELKRRIWEVLFLEIRMEPLFAVQRQLGQMVAAGLAAVWYAFAQILLVVQAAQPHAMRDFLGLSGMLFLSAATLAYVVKDRIKEFGRSYFGSGIFRRVPDHSERIYYSDRQGGRFEVGEIKERASYVPVEGLPAGVARLRAAFGYGQTCAEETVSGVLHYSKELKLSGKLRILNRYPLRAVHDILRLNIDAGLSRLGEPARLMNLVTPEGTVEAVRFPKVYYLDLVLSYSRRAPSGKSIEEALDYVRLVVDKNGLCRVERLS
jgi:hypothetical protein